MFANQLVKDLEKRFPSCGTDNDVYCVANVFDPSSQGAQVDRLNKLEQTKNFIIDQAQGMNINQLHMFLQSESSEEPDFTASELLLKKRKKESQQTVSCDISPNEVELSRYLNLRPAPWPNRGTGNEF